MQPLFASLQVLAQAIACRCFAPSHLAIGAMASDGPAFLAAAVRAACLAKAPRRTVQAVASAVAGVLARPAAAATSVPGPKVPAGSQRSAAAEPASDPSELLAALRAARSAQRKRKKERQRARKVTASAVLPEKCGACPPAQASDSRGSQAQSAASARVRGLRRAHPDVDTIMDEEQARAASPSSHPSSWMTSKYDDGQSAKSTASRVNPDPDKSRERRVERALRERSRRREVKKGMGPGPSGNRR